MFDKRHFEDLRQFDFFRILIRGNADRDFILRGEDAVAYGMVDAVLVRRELQLVPDTAAAASS